MWHVDNVCVDGLGHKKARFHQLAEGGVPMVGRDGTPTDGVLWLVNEGGKTSWLALVLALLRPKRTEFITRKKGRYLDDYVRASDQGHVMIVWSRPTSGSLPGLERDRLVTGMAVEGVAGDRPKVQFYTFRPASGWMVADLPVADVDGNRRRHAAFRQALVDDPKAHEPVFTTTLTEWQQILADRGVDPETYRLQPPMNVHEGGLSETFQFDTSDKFVEHVLRFVVHDESIGGIAASLKELRSELADKGRWEAEVTLISELLPHLDDMAAAWDLYEEANGKATKARTNAARAAHELAADAAHHRSRAATLRTRAQTADGRQREARRKEDEATLRRDAAHAVAADLRLVEARGQVEQAQDDADRAAADHTAWLAVRHVLSVAEQDRRADRLGRLLRQHEQDTEPLRAAVTEAAEALVAAAAAVRDRATHDRARAEAEAEQTAGQAKTASEDSVREDGRAERADADVKAARERVRAAEDQLADARRAGLLVGGETPPEGVVRLDEAADAAAETVEAAEQEVEDAHDQFDEAAGGLAKHQEVRAAREQDLEAALEARARLDAALADLREVQPLLDAADVAGPDELDPWAMETVLLRTLDGAARDHDLARASVLADKAADERVASWYDAHRTLPPSHDTEKVLAALEADGVAAWTGWHVLRDQVPAGERAARAAAAPDAACGVIVRDADMLMRAGEITAGGLGLAGPVLVTVPEALTGAVPTEDVPRTVVAGPAGLVDEDAAEQDAAASASRASTADSQADAHTDAAADIRDAVVALRGFLADWPDGPGPVEQSVTDATDARDKAARAVKDAERAVTRARERQREARKGERDARSDAEAVRAQAAQARTLQQQTSTVDADRAQAETRAGEAQSHRNEAARLRTLAERWTDQARAAEDAASKAAGIVTEVTTTVTTRQLALPGPAEPTGEPAMGQVASLAEDLDRSRQRLSQKTSGVKLQGELDEATRLRAEAQRALADLDPVVRERATQFADSPDAASPGTITAAQDRAATEATTANKALGKAENHLDKAAEAHRRAAALLDGTAPSHVLVPVPTDPDEADRIARDAETERARERENRAEHLRTANDATNEATNADTAAELAEETAAEIIDEAGGDTGPLADVPPSRAVAHANPTATRRTVLARVSKAEREAGDAVSQLRDHADLLDQALRAHPDEQAALAQHVARGTVTDRGRKAADNAADLRDRRTVAQQHLTTIAELRAPLVGQLTGEMRSAAKKLRRIQSASVLPPNLGDWSGKPFIRLNHKPVEDSHGAWEDRAGQVIDLWCGPDGPADPRPTDLLMAAIRMVVPDGFDARIYMPSPRLEAERIEVTKLRSQSGGQRLTAALVLFVTMCAIRRDSSTSRRTDEPTATLLLDNPIGTANEGTLIDLQRRVARACGIQLIYTTGVEDLNAVGQFPVTVRLAKKQNLADGSLVVVMPEGVVVQDDPLDRPDDTTGAAP